MSKVSIEENYTIQTTALKPTGITNVRWHDWSYLGILVCAKLQRYGQRAHFATKNCAMIRSKPRTVLLQPSR